jgi:hypothetical protein
MDSRAQEQREFLRVPFATEVSVQTSDRVYSSTKAINISMRGLCFSLEGTCPEQGSSCGVKIYLGAGEAREIIEAKAWVVRSEVGTVAVEFTEIDLESYYHLQRLIILNADDPEQAEKELCAHWGILRPRN